MALGQALSGNLLMGGLFTFAFSFIDIFRIYFARKLNSNYEIARLIYEEANTAGCHNVAFILINERTTLM